MALGKIKSCGWELEHSAEIAMQSEALICAAMALTPREDRLMFTWEWMCLVAVSRCRQWLSAFLLYPVNLKLFQPAPSSEFPSTFQPPPAELPLTSAWEKLIVFSQFVFLFSDNLCRDTYTCCLPEHLLCPATFSFLTVLFVIGP